MPPASRSVLISRLTEHTRLSAPPHLSSAPQYPVPGAPYTVTVNTLCPVHPTTSGVRQSGRSSPADWTCCNQHLRTCATHPTHFFLKYERKHSTFRECQSELIRKKNQLKIKKFPNQVFYFFIISYQHSERILQKKN